MGCRKSRPAAVYMSHTQEKKPSEEHPASPPPSTHNSDEHCDPPPVVADHEDEDDSTKKDYKDIEDTIKTGDLAVLYRAGQTEPYFAVFFKSSEVDKDFPLFFVRGNTKPMKLEKFKKSKSKREVLAITAVTRIFYGDYEKVAVRSLNTDKTLTHFNPLDIAEEVEKIPYTEDELKSIDNADSPMSRSRYICTYILAHIYHKLGILSRPADITPENFQDSLPLSKPVYIRLPPVEQGPLLAGDYEPPFLARLVKDLLPSSHEKTIPYDEIRETVQSGDIVLFSGATNSGTLIKLFTSSRFSHVGICVRLPHSAHVMVWESTPNNIGFVDVGSGSVVRGVDLVPLKNKIFSGWYDKVAIRRLTGLSDERRHEMYSALLKVRKELQGVPYEKDFVQLASSAINADYLAFLQNHEEDLSSIFCSELVAHAYQKLGLLGTDRPSNQYTPDDFSTNKDNLKLLEGELEPEVYVEMDFNSN